MKDGTIKRSITIAGHRTSVSIEGAFWLALKQIAKEREKSVAALIGEIDGARDKINLSSTIRLFVLSWYQRNSRS